MKSDYEDTYATLDWDNIDLLTCQKRQEKLKKDLNVRMYELRISPGGKGYHVKVWCYQKVHNVKFRVYHSDDPYRIIHDMLNRDSNIHNILWDIKCTNGVAKKAKIIYRWLRDEDNE